MNALSTVLSFSLFLLLIAYQSGSVHAVTEMLPSQPPATSDAPPFPPEQLPTVTLSGTGVSTDPVDAGAYKVSLVTGETREVTVTATLPAGAGQIIFSLEGGTSVPRAGFQLEYNGLQTNTCQAVPSCTLTLRIQTEKADVNHPNFPNTPGTIPTYYTVSLKASNGNAERTTTITLAVTSGELRIELGEVVPPALLSASSFFELKQADTDVMVVEAQVFPNDDDVTDTAFSISLDNPPAGLTLGFAKGGSAVSSPTCTKDELRAGCLFALTLAATSATPPGDYLARLAANGKEIGTFTIRVVLRGLTITSFSPFVGGARKARCAATINPEALNDNEKNNPPTPIFRLRYRYPWPKYPYDKTAKAKYLGGTNFQAEAALPSFHVFNKQYYPGLQAICEATIQTSKGSFMDTASIKEPSVVYVRFVELPTGKAECRILHKSEMFGLTADNQRLRVSL